jgi:hypothetical protein
MIMIGSDAGSVRIYGYGSGTWTKLGQDIDGEAIDEKFGASLSLQLPKKRIPPALDLASDSLRRSLATI